jgi:hypothetical protein
MVQQSMTTLSFWLINVVPDLLRRLFLFELKGVDDDWLYCNPERLLIKSEQNNWIWLAKTHACISSNMELHDTKCTCAMGPWKSLASLTSAINHWRLASANSFLHSIRFPPSPLSSPSFEKLKVEFQ